MSKKTLLFPGQGSQEPGMLKSQLTAVFDKASEILGYSLADVISNPDELNQTNFTQPSVFTASCAWFKELDIKDASFFIGHSLGEWSAATVAGCVSFTEGLKAVALRADLMNRVKDGAMAAVLGVNSQTVKSAIKDYDLVIANYNLPEQTVVSGSRKAIEEFAGNVEGFKVIPLKISGPFHSPWMKDAQKKFESSLKNLKFDNASTPIILNQTAQPETDGQRIKEALINQLTRPVLFYQSIGFAIDNGVTDFYEIGPGRVLTNMVEKINNTVSVNNAETLTACS